MEVPSQLPEMLSEWRMRAANSAWLLEKAYSVEPWKVVVYGYFSENLMLTINLRECFAWLPSFLRKTCSQPVQTSLPPVEWYRLTVMVIQTERNIRWKVYSVAVSAWSLSPGRRSACAVKQVEVAQRRRVALLLIERVDVRPLDID